MLLINLSESTAIFGALLLRRCYFATFATSTFFPLNFFRECWESNLGQLGPEAIALT